MRKEEQPAMMAAKAAAAQAILEAEIVKLHSGEDWLKYLDFVAKLHFTTPTMPSSLPYSTEGRSIRGSSTIRDPRSWRESIPGRHLDTRWARDRRAGRSLHPLALRAP